MPDRIPPTLAIVVALALLAAPAAGHDAGGGTALSLPLQHGQSYNETAHAAGTHPYHCHIHPWMQGILVVRPDPDPAGPFLHHIDIVDDGNATHAAAMGFRDAAGGNVTTVRLGDRIEWTNQGTLEHDVHIVWPAAVDGGAFEVWVAAGLVVALVGIYVAARRV